MLERTENMKIPQSNNASLQSISREVDLAWLAGIIDGEGNIQLSMKENANGSSYLDTKVRIYNTDVRMMQKVAKIYVNENIVFCYTIGNNNRKNPRWKRQMGIQVASHGSTSKLLNLVLPYLVNKKRLAEIMVEAIKHRKSLPYNGSRKRLNYEKDPKIIDAMSRFQKDKEFYRGPSETTRRAGTVCSW